MTDTPELLPCPFCGGDATNQIPVQEMCITCHTCEIDVWGDGSGIESAIAAWNRRSSTPAPVSGDLREMVKRAVLPIIDKVPAVDASQSRIRGIRAGWMADAALTALTPPHRRRDSRSGREGSGGYCDLVAGGR